MRDGSAVVGSNHVISGWIIWQSRRVTGSCSSAGMSSENGITIRSRGAPWLCLAVE